MGPTMFSQSLGPSSGRSSVLNPFVKNNSATNSIVMVNNPRATDGRKSVHPMMSGGGRQDSLTSLGSQGAMSGGVAQPNKMAYNSNLVFSVKDYIQEMDNED